MYLSCDIFFFQGKIRFSTISILLKSDRADQLHFLPDVCLVLFRGVEDIDNKECRRHDYGSEEPRENTRTKPMVPSCLGSLNVKWCGKDKSDFQMKLAVN